MKAIKMHNKYFVAAINSSAVYHVALIKLLADNLTKESMVLKDSGITPILKLFDNGY